MAFNPEDRTNLSNIAKNFQTRNLGEVQLPGGTEDPVDVQYTEMDMIAGICSAALFGASGKNKDNLGSLLATPDNFSYLGRILTFLNDKLIKQFTEDQNIENYGKKIRSSLFSKPINVKLVDIDPAALANLDTTNITNNIEEVISKEDKKPKAASSSSALAITINGVDNIKQLTDSLILLAAAVNDKGLIDGLILLFETLSQINQLTSVDTSKVVENINNINQLSQSLDGVKIEGFDSEQIKNIIDNSGQISKLIEAFNNLPTELKPNDLFKDNTDNLLNTINSIIKIIDSLSYNISKSELSKVEIKVNDFIAFLKNDKGGLSQLFTSIHDIMQSNDVLAIGDIKGLGELIEGIVSIAQFNGEIKTETLYELANLVEPDGAIGNIINSINKLGLKAVSKEALQSLSVVMNYFRGVTELTDLGLMGKLRIMVNIAFFRYYVNNALPSLIKDINKNFKGINLEDKNNTLNILQKYFNTLKSISSLSIKDQLNLVVSIKTLKTLVVDELAKVVKGIDEKFKDLEVSPNVLKVFTIFDKLKSLAIPKDFKEQQRGLKELQLFLFGSAPMGKGGKLAKIGKSIDYMQGKSSVLAILNRLKEESSSFSDVEKPLDQLQKALQAISKTISTNLNSDKVGKLSLSLYRFNNGVLDNLEKIGAKGKDSKYLGGLIVLKAFSSNINQTFKNVILDQVIQKIIVGKETYKQFKETIKLFEELPKLLKALEIASKINISDKVLKGLVKIADQLKVVVDKFAKIDTRKINTAIKLLKNITMFMLVTAGILILGSLVMSFIGFDGVFKFLLGMVVMVGLFTVLFKLLSKEFDTKQLAAKTAIVFKIGILMGALGLILFLGSYLAQKVEWGNIWKFLGGVGIMLAGTIVIMFLLHFADKWLTSSITSASQLAFLIIACGISVALASAVGSVASPDQILAFGGAIMMLLLGIMVPLIFFESTKVFMFKGINDLGILVLSCALTLALAGFVTKYIDMSSLTVFTALLTFLVSGILMVIGMFGSNEINGAKDIGKLVLYSALAMLLGGGLFMLLGDPFKIAVLEFTMILGIFVCGILLVLSLFGSEEIKAAEGLGKLVTFSAMAMLIGGLLFMLLGNKFKKAVIQFALTLFLFVLGISIAMAIVSASLNKETAGKMWQLSLLVLVAAMAITIGPLILNKYDIGFLDVLGFVFNALLLVGGMSLIVYLIGNVEDPMIWVKGIIVMFFIELLIYGLGVCIAKLAETVKTLDEFGYLNLWLGIGNIALILGAVIAAVAGLGMALTGPQVLLLLAGAAGLATLEGLIWGLSKCIISIVNAVKALESIKNVNISEVMTPIFGFIGESIKAFGQLSGKEMLQIGIAIRSLSGIGTLIANIAEGVQKYAELKVPIGYDKDGKPLGFRQLVESDFTSAAKNISTIITTLGGTILAIYQGKLYDPVKGTADNQIMSPEDAKEMFAGGGLFSGGTRFSKVVKSVSKLGKMISDISEGIQNYANLVIPTAWDKDGKPIAFKKMGDKEFVDASIAISKVVTTLGLSIMGLYYGKRYNPDTGNFTAFQGFTPEMAKEMFAERWFGKSPFKRVVDATSKLGSLIASLAFGIQMYAMLRVPDEFNSKGEATHWKKMTDDDFTNAGIAIGKVVYALGKSIMDIANSQQFATWYDQDRLTNIVDAIGKVSNFIGPLSTTIAKYALGKFPLLEYKDGKLTTNYENGIDISTYEGGWEGLQNDLNTSISHVLLGLGLALNGVLNPEDKQQKAAINQLLYNPELTQKLIKNISDFSQTIKNVFSSINEVLKISDSLNTENESITDRVTKAIQEPFKAFINSLDLKNKVNPTMQEMFDNPKQTNKFITNVGNLASTIKSVFGNIKDTIDISKAIYGETESGDREKSGLIYKFITTPLKNFCSTMDWLDENDKTDPRYLVKTHPNRTEDFFTNALYIGDKFISLFKKIKEITDMKIELTSGAISGVVKWFIQGLLTILGSDQNKAFTKEKGNELNILVEKSLIPLSENLIKLFKNLDKIIGDNKWISDITIDLFINKPFYKYLELLNYLNIIEFNNEKFGEITNFNKTVNDWINIIKQIDPTLFPNQTNLLANSITQIFDKIATLQAEKNNQFKDHVDTLERYVKQINAIDVSKVESMTTLANSVTNLGNKIGNIDKFTEVLATKISKVLIKLSTSMNAAAAIIKNSDQLHEKRKKHIQESINTIKSLMEKEMVVKIENEQPPTQEGSPDAGTTPENNNNGTVNVNTPETPGSIPTSNSGKSGGGNNSGGSGKSKSIGGFSEAELKKIIKEAIQMAK